jgi:hypothetical protein
MLGLWMALHALPLAAQDKPFIPDAENSWAFEPDDDVDAQSPIDLRRLNEKHAGEHGFIRVSRDGRGFVRGDGKPIRFWATHATNVKRLSDEQLRQYCRFLAKMGVNLGLAGSALQPAPNQPDLLKTHPGKLDETWRLVAAFKREGIYSEIRGTWFFRGFVKVPGIDGYKPGQSLHAVIFFSPKLQEAYRAWLKDLLTRKNPYTQIPLKDDPALAMITLFNEDSMFFYTFQSLRGKPLANAQKMFGDWAKNKYGSLEKALEAWGGLEAEGDDIRQGRLGFLTWWFAGQAGRKQMTDLSRLRDQAAFVAQVGRDYYAGMKRWLQEDLGCRQLVMTSNFRSAETAYLQDLENWVKAAGDVVVMNSYPGVGPHLGQRRGYMIEAGDFFKSYSLTTRPLELAQVHRQVAGHPFIVSETLWANPSEYTNESALLNAIYTNVANMAASSFAGPRQIGYGGKSSYYFPFGNKGSGHPIQKWDSSEPGHLIGYPAAALIARGGYGMQDKPALIERRTFKDLLTLQPPRLPEGLDFDPLYESDTPGNEAQTPASQVPPEAYLMGPVLVDFNPGETILAQKVKRFDRSSPVVESLDATVRCDRKKGLVTLDTPEAKAAVGFLKAAGTIKLTDVTIESENEHVGVAVVALDNKPLTQSAKILIQVTPRARPTGWKVEPAVQEDKKSGRSLTGWRILNTGKVPFRMENITGQVTIRNATVTRAVALDEMGRPEPDETVEFSASDGQARLKLPRQRVWVILE